MTDVVVVGAGIVGAAVARELAVRGVEVTLLDRGAVSSGTTGLGEGNVLCSDKDPGPELELARAGLAMYGEVEERLGDEARIRRKGALIVHPEATWAAEPARVERIAIPGARLVGADELRELEPELTGACTARASSPATSNAIRARSRGRWHARPQCGCDGARGLRGRCDRDGGARRADRRRRGRRHAAGARGRDRGRPVERAARRERRARRSRSSRARASSCGLRRPSRTRPPQGRRRLLSALGRERCAADSSSRPWSRRPGTATCSSAPHASGAASTRRRPGRQRRAGRARGAAVPAPRGCPSPPPGPGCGRGCPTTCRRSARHARPRPLARDRPRGRRRRARPRHGPADRAALLRRGAGRRPCPVRPGPLQPPGSCARGCPSSTATRSSSKHT